MVPSCASIASRVSRNLGLGRRCSRVCYVEDLTDCFTSKSRLIWRSNDSSKREGLGFRVRDARMPLDCRGYSAIGESDRQQQAVSNGRSSKSQLIWRSNDSSETEGLGFRVRDARMPLDCKGYSATVESDRQQQAVSNGRNSSAADKTLDILGWPSLGDAAARFATTAMGKELCHGLAPPRTKEESQVLLDETSAALELDSIIGGQHRSSQHNQPATRYHNVFHLPTGRSFLHLAATTLLHPKVPPEVPRDRDGEDTILACEIRSTDRRVADQKLLPIVMIVGRPNVGKSALFNRLTRRREALVYNTPEGHVTRDIREGIAKLGGLSFKVLDSAGLETFDHSESILGRTAGISAVTLQKCHIAIFLVDGRAGLQPMDSEVGKWLRKVGPHVKVVVAMNKSEGIHHDPTGRLLAALGETHQLGFGDPVPLSAEAGEGMGDLFDTLRPLLEEAQDSIRKLDPDVLQTKQDESLETKLPMQLAIAGRPNVGKSTLVNALLKEERVLTGPEPGLTRDSVSVEFNYKGQKVRLVDTAGWMQRGKVEEGPSALSAMHARKGVMMSHVVALVLDGEEIAKTKSSMRHAEASLARWAVEEGRGLVVVVNKMDLLSGKDKEKLRRDVMRAVPIEIQTILPQVSGVPVAFTSALEKKGRKEFMENVLECYEKWNARYSTAELNRWLRKVMSRHPRSGSGYGAKVRYMTQVKARPPTFVVFVSGAGELEDTDLRFLASALREDFGLGGIPLRILQRASKDKKKS